MTADVELRPGLTPLIHWRAIYRGAPVALDPFARPDVEAGAAALAEIIARRELPPADEPPSIADLMENSGDRLPSALVRLFVALKLGSLSQGVSGMRWDTLRGLADFLAAGLLPVVPVEDAGDRLALSYLFAALTGTGEVVLREKRRPAAKALKEAELAPLQLTRQERHALLSGVALTTATALAGLFEAERVFHSALVAAALSAEARSLPWTPLHRSVHRLNRQPGQIEVAATLRTLRGIAEAAEAEGTGEIDQTEKTRRAEPFKLGACLDLLRQAGATLERAANAVTEDRLVLWQSGALVAGAEDRSSAARAANLVALALTGIGDLSQARIGALFAAAQPGVESDADRASSAGRAADFAAGIREHAESGLGVRRLLPMAGMAALVLAVEFLEAARVRDARPEATGAALADVLRLVHEAAPRSAGADLSEAGGLASIADRIGSGAFTAAASEALPGVVPRPPERMATPLGGRTKRK